MPGGSRVINGVEYRLGAELRLGGAVRIQQRTRRRRSTSSRTMPFAPTWPASRPARPLCGRPSAKAGCRLHQRRERRRLLDADWSGEDDAASSMSSCRTKWRGKRMGESHTISVDLDMGIWAQDQYQGCSPPCTWTTSPRALPSSREATASASRTATPCAIATLLSKMSSAETSLAEAPRQHARCASRAVRWHPVAGSLTLNHSSLEHGPACVASSLATRQ